MGICQTIAHGVLLFLPSYRLLNLLTERWQNTGLHEELCKKKVVVVEPKFSRDFEQSIRHFYDAIETTTKFPNAVSIGGIHKLREQSEGRGGVLKMFILLYNPYLVKWFTREEGVLKKAKILFT